MGLYRRLARENRGFTLFEVMIATLVMTIAVLGTISLIDYANGATAANQNRTRANNIARQIAETTRQLPYVAVTSGGLVSALQNFTLPDGTKPLADSQPLTPGWQIAQGVRASDAQSASQTFTVTAVACSVDDSKDGYGATHDPAITWCNSNTGGADTTPEDYKRVTVSITPPAGTGVSKPVTMSEIVGNNRATGGAGSGTMATRAILQSPLCTGCNTKAWNWHEEIAPCFHFTATVGTDNCLPTFDGAAGPNFTGNQITQVPVKTIWETPPASVKFYLELYPAGYPGYPVETFLGNGTVDPANGSIFNYTWALGNTYPNQTSDGGYGIKAIAYDASSQQIGSPQLLNLWLNRFIPDLKSVSPVAGKDALFSNYPVVEWLPFKAGYRADYDFTSFKVYRNGTLICTHSSNPFWEALIDLTLPTPNFAHQQTGRCQDTAAPASGSVTYTIGVTTYSPDGTVAPSEGGNVQTSANVNATPVNNRPSAPTGFSATWVRDVNSNWVTRFNWTNPAARGDADTGDCLTSFRIYETTTTSQTQPTFTQSFYRTSTGVGNVTAPCYSTGTTSFTANYSAVDGPRAKGPPPNGQTLTYKFFITGVDTHNNESTVAAGQTYTLATHPTP